MPRYRLTIEYDGGPFVGWQRQDNGPSIQGSLEDAIEKLSGERVTVTGAGRTDAGVHALGQVAHFDLVKEFAADKVRDALNYHVRPAAVAVLDAAVVADDFHARFSATARHYLFRILNRRAPAILDAGKVWPVAIALDAEAMHAAAQMLLGNHDFTTFRAAECQAQSPVKTLDRLDVSRRADEIHIEASARVLPASSGALHRRHLEAGGRRQMGHHATCPMRSRRATAAAADRWRRRTDFIWCAWITSFSPWAGLTRPSRDPVWVPPGWAARGPAHGEQDHLCL